MSPTPLATHRRRRLRLVSLSALAVQEESAEIAKQAEDNVVDFPPPLTGLQRATRAVEFYKRALPVLAAYKAKEVELGLREKFLGETDIDQEQIWKELDEWGSQRIADTIQEMKGFYVKTGQVISTRVDLFPEAYTSKLQQLQDGIEPMPFDMVKRVVEQELLDGAPLSELFATFEEEPLGSASIAQVHKATLLDGRVVAVKLQRPNVEPKLRGDIANLKRISKALAKQLPVDYYAVFCELGEALENELDFLAEAQAMRKIHLATSHDVDGTLTGSPVSVPLPIGELVTKRVLVMDFVEGVPLNKLQQKMKEKGIQEGSPEAKIAGRRILDSLALAFGRMIFGAGYLHGDPHPGNIFIGEGGSVSLIDCGQFKSLSRSRRLQFAELVLAVKEYQKQCIDVGGAGLNAAKKELANCARSFGIKCVDGRETEDDLACSVALVLFSDTGVELPGGYSANELSEDSPIRLLTSFPQELILLGRATILLKGIARKLNVDFSLVNQWGPGCRMTLNAAKEPSLPLWGREIIAPYTDARDSSSSTGSPTVNKVQFRQVAGLLKTWAKGKGTRFAERSVKKLPPKWKNKVLEYKLSRDERKAAQNKL